MQEEFARLHSEVAQLKQLLLQLAPRQGLGDTSASVHQSDSQTLVSAQLQQQTVTEHEAEGHRSAQAGPRPKLAVQLDLPHEEQPCGRSSNCHAAVPQPLHPQQLDPLLVLGPRLKPSISNAVMLQRAFTRQQEAAREQIQREHGCPHVVDCSSPEQCSTPITCDAAVHVIRAAPDDKQQTHPQSGPEPQLSQEQHACETARQHKLATPAAGSWQPTGSRGIDALTRRVHDNKELRCELGPVQQHQQQPQAKALTRAQALAGMLEMLRMLFWDVAQPGDLLVLLWDVVMLVLIIYICIICPFTVAFAVDFTDLTQPLAQLDLAASALFMWDCWMNFRTAYVDDEGRVVSCQRRIAAHYAQGWFVFDLVSSLPYEQLLSSNPWGFSSLAAFLKVPRLLRILKILRLLKLLKMTRLVKLPQLMSRLQWLLNRPMMQLSTMCAAVCLLLHWVACAWYYVAMFVEDTDNWVVTSGLADATDGSKYVTALYWSISTVATVGFGDVVAHSIREKVVALITMLIGASVFGYFMGAMSVMVSATNSNRARMTAKRRAVDEFLMHRRVPRSLADKVKSYFDYVVEREVQADEADIIAGLSANLRTQVVLHLYQEALEKVPFFKGQPPHFITSVVTFLQLEYYAPGDIVVRQGDISDTIFFLAQGSLEVRLYQDEGGCPLARPTYMRSSTKAKRPQRPSTPCQQHNQDQDSQQLPQQRVCGPFIAWLSKLVHRRNAASCTGDSCAGQSSSSGLQHAARSPRLPACNSSTQWTYEDELAHRPYRQLGHLHPGEYFGEYSCLLGQECSATVVAGSYAEVYSLRRSDLETVLQQWPELAEQFEAMVQEAGSQATGADTVAPVAAACQRSSCAPLAHWSLVKAACQQHTLSSAQVLYSPSSSVMPLDGTTAVQTPTTTSTGPLAAAQGQAPACAQDMPTDEARQQLQQQEALQSCVHDGGCRCRQASSVQQQGSTVLQQTRSEPIDMDAATAACTQASQWQWQLQQHHDWAAVQNGQWHTAGETRMSIPEDPTSAGSATYSAPSLVARSVSVLSTMSGLPAGSRAQRSGSLSRRSVPAGRVSSMSGGGSSVNLARAAPPCGFASALDPRGTMNWLPGQGTGLFRSNSGQRYLFPANQDRSGALLPQPQAQDELHPGVSVLQQQRSLTRHSTSASHQEH